MKIAIDIHHLLLEHAGTRRITLNLLDQFRNRKDVDLLELTPSYGFGKGKGIQGKLWKHFFRFFWVHVQLPLICLKQGVDVLISPEFNTPIFTFCKRAVIVPDAHMRAQKEFTNKIWFYLYYIPFIEIAIRSADRIYTISEFAKKEIVDFIKLDVLKVRVVYIGIDNFFQNVKEESKDINKIRQFGLNKKGYILFVGTFEARKNIERLIEAFFILKHKIYEKIQDLKLVIVGKPSSSLASDRSKQIQELIEKLDIKSQVVLCGFASDDLLANLYKDAIMVAFPSLHEGFGLPIIEGFASGTPVLTSNICSMPEIAGNAALLVNPFNVEEIVKKMEMILFDSKLRQDLIEKGLKRVKEFTWERTANQIISDLSSTFFNQNR